MSCTLVCVCENGDDNPHYSQLVGLLFNDFSLVSSAIIGCTGPTRTDLAGVTRFYTSALEFLRHLQCLYLPAEVFYEIGLHYQAFIAPTLMAYASVPVPIWRILDPTVATIQESLPSCPIPLLYDTDFTTFTRLADRFLQALSCISTCLVSSCASHHKACCTASAKPAAKCVALLAKASMAIFGHIMRTEFVIVPTLPMAYP